MPVVLLLFPASSLRPSRRLKMVLLIFSFCPICLWSVFSFSSNYPKLAARWVADDCESDYDSAAASRGPSRSYVSALLGEVSMSLVDNK